MVKDGRAAAVDALARSRHGRTPRPGAAYAGWHGGDGRRGKEAGHRRHITANNDHHRPKLRRSTGEVRPHTNTYTYTHTTAPPPQKNKTKTNTYIILIGAWKYWAMLSGMEGEIITLWFVW